MRFDDRLNTVLAQPASNPHDRAIRWRQLVELLARASDLSSPLARQALDEIRRDLAAIDEQLRAAAARAVARPQLPAELVAAFAGDSIAVAAPVLAAASLSSEELDRVLDEASAESRRFIRALHPELPQSEPPAPATPEPQVETAAAPQIPSISDVLARIERIRQERDARAPARPRVQRAAEGGPALFRWECGPSGEIGWVEGVPRGALIGRSLANPGEHNGVDRRIQRAFGLRAPFRDATLTLGGDGVASGEWKLSGVPAFDPADGRFAGYRGVGVRAPEPEQEAEQGVGPERQPLDDHSLRELVHELKTPLNAIIGFAEIIDGQYLGPADHRYRERAAEIVAQARLLLSAIEDLDIAARLRSAPAAAGGSADLGDVLAALGPQLNERAGRRGVAFELKPPRGPAECALSPAVLERLVRRFCEALIDSAIPRERLSLAADCEVGQCVIGSNLPQALRGLTEQQLFGQHGDTADALAPGFSLKLARGIAQTAGGDLRLSGDRLAMVLPRRTP